MKSDDEVSARPCPVCGLPEKKRLFAQRFIGAGGASLLSGYAVVVCRRCGFGFADNLPAQEAFDEYYRELSKYEHQEQQGKLSADDVQRHAQTAQFLRSHLPARPGRILDVGCANGGLLNALRQYGCQELLGLDPSPICARMARELYGLEVLTGTLANLPDKLGFFELVILGSVLEHVRDLLPSLQRVTSLLQEQGRVYVEVPDASRFAVVTDAPFQEFSVEHINYFGPTSLANLMRAQGLAPVFSSSVLMAQSGTMSQVIQALFEKRADLPPADPVPDRETEAGLRAYIRACRQAEKQIHRQLEPWIASQRPLIVWGVGTHTQRLLATSRLASARIVAFVDSNPHYQGKELQGVPVLAPEALRGRSEPILISSRGFQNEIVRQIRTGLGLRNELILLYRL